MNAGKMQHLQDNLILHLAPTVHQKQNKLYFDKFMRARRSANDYYYVLSDFLFDAVTFLQANTSVVHKIMKSLALMAVVFKISWLHSIQFLQDEPVGLESKSR